MQSQGLLVFHDVCGQIPSRFAILQSCHHASSRFSKPKGNHNMVSMFFPFFVFLEKCPSGIEVNHSFAIISVRKGIRQRARLEAKVLAKAFFIA